jgi:hypothetical protein
MLQVLDRQTNAEISEPDDGRFRSITARAIPVATNSSCLPLRPDPHRCCSGHG